MNTFKTLVDSGIASLKYEFAEITGLDSLSKFWNMYWGHMTDTHMQPGTDCWIITGSRVSDKRFFSSLLETLYIENFRLPYPWANVMSNFNLVGDYINIMGQQAYRIMKV